MPKVSIGLPVHNGERFLSAALDSILNQEFADFELIISDNASTDATEEICGGYARKDARIRYERMETNIGAAGNFNRVFGLAQGDYFKWAAHDDLCLPGFLKQCVSVLDADPDVVLCHSEVQWIDQFGTFMPGERDFSGLGQGQKASHRFREVVLLDHWCLDVFGVIRRPVLKETPLIAPYIGSDRVLLAELSLLGRLFRVADPLFLSRDHESRSVRALRLRERAAWFQPRLAGKRVFPYWRMMTEYFGIIFRSPLPLGERARCFSVMLRWMVQNREFLLKDLRAGLRR